MDHIIGFESNEQDPAKNIESLLSVYLTPEHTLLSFDRIKKRNTM